MHRLKKRKLTITLLIFIILITYLNLKFNKDVIVSRKADRTWAAIDNFGDPGKAVLRLSVQIENKKDDSGPFSIICRVLDERIAGILKQDEILLCSRITFPYRRDYLIYDSILFQGKEISSYKSIDIYEKLEIVVLKNNKIVDSYKIKTYSRPW
jgi:hypothetical protein